MIGFSISSKTFLTLRLFNSVSITFLASLILLALVNLKTSSSVGLVRFESATQRARHSSLVSCVSSPKKERFFCFCLPPSKFFTLSPIVLNSSSWKRLSNLSSSRFFFHSGGKTKWMGASVRIVARVLENRASSLLSNKRFLILSLTSVFLIFL